MNALVAPKRSVLATIAKLTVLSFRSILVSNSRSLAIDAAAGAAVAIAELRGGSALGHDGGIASFEEAREIFRSYGARRGEGGVDCVGRAGSQRQELPVLASRRLLAIPGCGCGGMAVPRSHDVHGPNDLILLVLPDGFGRCRHSSALLRESLGETVLHSCLRLDFLVFRRRRLLLWIAHFVVTWNHIYA